MGAYAFRAVDAAGKPQRGVLEAPSPAGARQTLRERNLLPVSVQAASTTGVPAIELGQIQGMLTRRTGSKTLANATRQLSTLIGSDIRIEEALRIVARQNEGRPLGGVLLGVRGSVLEGRSFAEALGEHPSVFPQFYQASIAASERSGRLAEVLAHLTDFVEKRERARQKIQLALIYPALLAAVSLTIVVLLLIYVVPDIVRVFVSRGAELPLLTRMLIGLSEGVQQFGWLFALLFAGAVLAGSRWAAVPANRLALHRFAARAPLIGALTRQLSAARFAGSLATLVQSDVPLVDAIAAAGAVTPNLHIRASALGVAARVREGTSLHQAMTDADCFPSMLVAIAASGESSGKLGLSLGRAAEELDHELEGLTTAMVSLVEPAVLLAMGGMVLMLVLAILMPIINMTSLAGV